MIISNSPTHRPSNPLDAEAQKLSREMIKANPKLLAD